MAINADQVGSPGWWMRRLFNMLGGRNRQNRLNLLNSYRIGQPPLPQGAESHREAYEAFVKKSRSNFAELVVSAISERIAPVGFRTGQDDDETGDEEVGAMWERSGMNVEATNLQDMTLTFGEAYAIVGDLDPETGSPVVTAEDPRWIVGDPDPAAPRRLRAALKVVYDDMVNEDRAYLYMPGRVFVARRRRSLMDSVTNVTGESRGPILTFNPEAWDWDNERSGEITHGKMPVVRFLNKDGLGEFEPHIDLLDRINHQTLQTMVIGTMQAFRVRAVKNLPLKDSAGNEVDYSSMFTLDPGAIWQLPKDVDLWESETTDLRPLLEAIKDDLTRLASVTRTPMHMLHPGGANQSAEGANLQREGLVFKAEDRINRWKPSYQMLASLMLLVAGDAARSDLGKLQAIFAAPERLSLSERADAATKATNDMPTKTRLVRIWGLTPAEAERTLSELADERLLAVQLQAAVAAGPQPVGGRQEQQPDQAGGNGDQQPPGQQQPPGRQGGGNQ